MYQFEIAPKFIDGKIYVDLDSIRLLVRGATPEYMLNELFPEIESAGYAAAFNRLLDAL